MLLYWLLCSIAYAATPTTTSDTHGVVTDVDFLANSIEQHGFTAVFVGFILVAFTLSMLYIVKSGYDSQKQNTEFFKISLNENKQLQEKILDAINKISIGNRNLDEAVATEETALYHSYLEITTSIKSVLDSYLAKNLVADRISLCGFHNGQHTITYLPFFKLSCLSEAVREQKMANMGKVQNIPINFLPFLANAFTDTTIVNKNDFLEERYGLRENDWRYVQTLLADDDNFCILSSICRDSTHTFIGLLIVEFTKNPSEDEINKTNGDLLKLRDTLAPLLELSHYSKIKKSINN